MTARSRRVVQRASLAGAAFLFAACETPAWNDPLRFGAAYGRRQTEYGLDRRSASDEQDFPVTEDGGGFLEVAAPGEVRLHGRVLFEQSTVRSRSTVADARFTDVTALGLLGTEVPIVGPVTLIPMFGLGLGYVDVDIVPPGDFGDREGLKLAVAAAAEIEVARHVFGGVMGQLGVFGYPGDTEGALGSALVYVGVRF
jgi:hypothetical protein